LKNDVNVPSKGNMQKKLEKKTVGILKVTEEKSRKEQDPDPDPYQHVADPEH
jgi:hypothetical protein